MTAAVILFHPSVCHRGRPASLMTLAAKFALNTPTAAVPAASQKATSVGALKLPSIILLLTPSLPLRFRKRHFPIMETLQAHLDAKRLLSTKIEIPQLSLPDHNNCRLRPFNSITLYQK